MTVLQAAAEGRSERLQELCAATIRALAGDPLLHFRGTRLWRGARALPHFGPHLAPALEAGDDGASFRGAADALALRLVHGDAALHRSLVPADATERWVFELLEQLRCEALATAGMPGLRSNLRHRFEQWSLAFHRSGLTESDRGLLLYALAQIARSRIGGEPVLEATEDLIEATRASIVPLIGGALAGLRRERRDQRAFAVHALAIARVVAQSLRADDAALRSGRDGEDEEDRVTPRFSLHVDFDAEGDDGIAQVAGGDGGPLADSAAGYRIYTALYDCEFQAASRVRRALLDEYRERLDRRIAEQGLNASRLARELAARLALPQRDGWDDGQEEGWIDARRLAQLIASPAERRLFRAERITPRPDCAVAFLIDCSGSMREHVEAVAMLVDVVARALEAAGASCEVLGYTTAAWNGGRALRDWQRAGRPRHPGRLAERCHLVFKDADTPWRRARRDIAALLKSDLFREGLDGEAVAWGCERLRAGAAARRVLLVVSDGSPMDSATALANDAQFLDRHLREVVAREEAEGGVEVCGIGVGLDLSPYYRRSTALDLRGGLGNAALFEVARMLNRHRLGAA